jgi:hypothetical protein
MSGQLYAVQHRVCGHVSATTTERTRAENTLALLVGAGYHQWRVRILAAEEAVAQVLTDTVCGTCKVDPQRGLLPAAQAAAASLLGGGLA